MIDSAVYQEISFDEKSFNKQCAELLLKLEKDLEILKVDLDEDLNEDFKELKELKETAALSIINIKA